MLAHTRTHAHTCYEDTAMRSDLTPASTEGTTLEFEVCASLVAGPHC